MLNEAALVSYHIVYWVFKSGVGFSSVMCVDKLQL